MWARSGAAMSAFSHDGRARRRAPTGGRGRGTPATNATPSHKPVGAPQQRSQVIPPQVRRREVEVSLVWAMPGEAVAQVRTHVIGDQAVARRQVVEQVDHALALHPRAMCKGAVELRDDLADPGKVWPLTGPSRWAVRRPQWFRAAEDWPRAQTGRDLEGTWPKVTFWRFVTTPGLRDALISQGSRIRRLPAAASA